MNNPVLLFDGVCNLCTGMVQFVLKHEKDTQIKFGSLQSEAGQQYLEKFKITAGGMQSVVFIENNNAFVKSEAAFRIAQHLVAPWSWTAIFRFLPRLISDFFYDVIAKYRYRIFGKSEICMVPETEWESRFLR